MFFYPIKPSLMNKKRGLFLLLKNSNVSYVYNNSFEKNKCNLLHRRLDDIHNLFANAFKKHKISLVLNYNNEKINDDRVDEFIPIGLAHSISKTIELNPYYLRVNNKLTFIDFVLTYFHELGHLISSLKLFKFNGKSFNKSLEKHHFLKKEVKLIVNNYVPNKRNFQIKDSLDYFVKKENHNYSNKYDTAIQESFAESISLILYLYFFGSDGIFSKKEMTSEMAFLKLYKRYILFLIKNLNLDSVGINKNSNRMRKIIRNIENI